MSLVPSSTETLLALGAHVIACTRFCEQAGVPTVGGTKNPDVQAIIALEPDLVVMDREENRVEDHDALVDAGLHVYVSDVRSLDDARNVVGVLRRLVGMPTAPLPDVPPVTQGGRRTAFVPIWRRPWMSINDSTYGASVLRHLGVDLVTADEPVRYPVLELDDIVDRRPDLVLVPSEPYAFTAGHLDGLRRSFPSAQVIEVDGRDLFWWGVRTPVAVFRLAHAITPPVRR